MNPHSVTLLMIFDLFNCVFFAFFNVDFMHTHVLDGSISYISNHQVLRFSAVNLRKKTRKTKLLKGTKSTKLQGSKAMKSACGPSHQ